MIGPQEQIVHERHLSHVATRRIVLLGGHQPSIAIDLYVADERRGRLLIARDDSLVVERAISAARSGVCSDAGEWSYAAYVVVVRSSYDADDGSPTVTLTRANGDRRPLVIELGADEIDALSESLDWLEGQAAA